MTLEERIEKLEKEVAELKLSAQPEISIDKITGIVIKELNQCLRRTNAS